MPPICCDVARPSASAQMLARAALAPICADMGGDRSGTTRMGNVTEIEYAPGMTRKFQRLMLGTAAVVVVVATASCIPQEMGAAEFILNSFCNNLNDQPVESVYAIANAADAREVKQQVVEYSRLNQDLAPPEIKDAVYRMDRATIYFLDVIISTDFNPSLLDPAEAERLAMRVEEGLAATDEVLAWVNANCYR